MLPWLANSPTPQFCHVLNAITASHPELAVTAVYQSLGDGGRGWGALTVEHPHYVAGGGSIQRFTKGIRLALRHDVGALVVFGYNNALSVGALMGARFARKRVFTQSDSSSRNDREAQLGRRLIKHAFMRILFGKRATAWVVSSENAEYWRQYGIRSQHFVPFESPVPVPDMDHLVDAAAMIRQRLLPDASCKLLISVCRVTRAKGVEDLDAALRKLRDEGVGIHGAVIGPKSEDYEFVPSSLNLEGPCGRDELASYFMAADVFVLASHREAYGLVVREALQFGLPVVATTGVPSARALCDRGWNIVESGQPEALASAILAARDEERWPPQAPIDTVPFYLGQLNKGVPR